jgi:YggT family protein
MFVLDNFLSAVARIVDLILSIYMWAIIIRSILSWVSPFSGHPIAHFLYRITEPVLGGIRRRLPLRGMGVDLSPMLAILIIMFLQYFLVATLHDLGRRL